jgi:hypothetical protein
VISRRDVLRALAASPLACSRGDAGPAAPAPAVTAARAPSPSSSPADAGPARGQTRILRWTLPERGPTGEVAIVVPERVARGEAPSRWPLLVALHGHGEAMKPPPDGAMGWIRDYGLPNAIDRVSNPPLTADDVQGFVDPDRLAFYNAQLGARPFGGLVVVCPYLPEMNLRSHADLADYGRYLVEVVVPRARRELPVLASPMATGIDGVSMGGATALRAGFAHVETFGAVGALQPALSDDQVDDFVEVAKAARARRPGLPLRLTTSHEDVYEAAITHLSHALVAAAIPHDFADIPGPHDYPFNRGPGAIEMLLWHDRVLARTERP